MVNQRPTSLTVLTVQLSANGLFATFCSSLLLLSIVHLRESGVWTAAGEKLTKKVMIEMLDEVIN